MTYELVKVASPQEWHDYHAIRRAVLWEARGRSNYNEHHEDEHLPANTPLLMKLDGKPIGTTRLDGSGNGMGVVRMVAITSEMQHRGHGRALSQFVENYAYTHGLKTLFVNAAPDAIGYYEKMGWEYYSWNEAELTGIASDCVQMRKFLMVSSFLPEIPPHISFKPLATDSEAFEFSFAVKKEAIGPHIRARWEWDEAYQRATHKARLAEKPFLVIMYDNKPIGTLSWVVYPDHARFGEFYLFKDYQGRGLGTKILTYALAKADAAELPVRLEYLKWNPVGSLYLRNGFKPIRESDIHVFLERRPSKLDVNSLT